MHNFKDKVKRYFSFTPEETKALIITVLSLSLIVGLNDGRDTFDMFLWFHNFIGTILIVLITVLINQAGHRLYALHKGYKVEYQIWWYGLMIGLAFSLVSRGNLLILVPGGIIISQLAYQKIGKFPYFTSNFDMGMIALAGPLANILFATALKTIEVWFGVPLTEVPLLDMLFKINWYFAVWNLLPIPSLAGSKVFFGSRLLYIFLFGCIAGYILLFSIGIYSFIWATVIGIGVWISYYILVEKK